MSLFSCRNRDPAIFVGEDMNHRTLFSIGAVVDRGWSTAGETGVRVVPSAADASRRASKCAVAMPSKYPAWPPATGFEIDVSFGRSDDTS